jgi:hypothetical protein
MEIEVGMQCLFLLQLLILLPSTLWLSSSPTHSHYSVVAGSLPLPLDRSLWWKGERGKEKKAPGPGQGERNGRSGRRESREDALAVGSGPDGWAPRGGWSGM